MADQKKKSITRADFQAQVNPNAVIVSQAKKALFKAIKGSRRATPLGKRVVLWMIETASRNLATAIEVSLLHERWGRDLVTEIQASADVLSDDAMRPLWFACGVGRHLTHHVGGRDNLQRWSNMVRASTLWIAEGADYYNEKGKALVIVPNLAEIGCYSVPY